MSHWIPCEKLISHFPDLKWHNWKERLYFERLEQKTTLIHQLLKANKNDWEETLFQLLAKNFGLNINGNTFLKWAQHLHFCGGAKKRFGSDNIGSSFYGPVRSVGRRNECSLQEAVAQGF